MEELETAIREEWERIAVDTVQNLIESMPKCIESVCWQRDVPQDIWDYL